MFIFIGLQQFKRHLQAIRARNKILKHLRYVYNDEWNKVPIPPK